MCPLWVALVVGSLCANQTDESAIHCREPPGHEPACLDPPVVVSQPRETAGGELVDDEGFIYRRGLFWPSADDNSTFCACTRAVRTPIAKCCQYGYALQKGACVESAVEFVPVVAGPGGDLDLVEYAKVTMAACENVILLDAEDILEVTASGRLLTRMEALPAVEATRFCVDASVDHGVHQTVAICWDGSAPPLEPIIAVLASSMLVSVPFLLATAGIHLLLASLRNLHGWTLVSHTSALSVAYASLSTIQIFSDDISDTACVVCAFIIYFSFLASFFWLNVMCFDIFWTFSGFRSLRGTAREREHKKFIIYSIYSWGCPLIMLSVTLVMQFHNNIPEGFLRPQFGEKKCWFPDDKITTLAYFYGPVGVLVLCNIILFILTALKIAQLKKETAMLKGTDSRRHDDDNRQRFNLYLKLFLVMGVNWSMEVISWLVGGPEYVWYVTDICNTLQGVLIFVIFVWKDRIRRMLMEKFCPKRASTKLSKSTAVTYSTRASPSRLSHGMLNNKVVDNGNGNGEAVKIVAITHLSDDSDVP